MRVLAYHKGKSIITARLIAVVIALTLMLSIVFLVREADHKCTGEGCPICALMGQCEENIRLLGSGIAVMALDISLRFDFLKDRQHCYLIFLAFATLVTQYIRMND